MPAFIKNLTFDCVDPLQVATFWAAALGSEVDDESTSEKAFVEAPGWGGPSIWFNRAGGSKRAKNRIHLDLRAIGSIPDEVDRLVLLGATVSSENAQLVVMADPEGNEFCVE
jgi:hypothetical protein